MAKVLIEYGQNLRGDTMHSYAYAYRKVTDSDETFFRVPRLPEIISSVQTSYYNTMNEQSITTYIGDAIITALQSRISARIDIPLSDDIDTFQADGFYVLTVQQAMKLELYRLYKTNSISISEFSRSIDRRETAARRLLDLRHQSWPTEIESAVASFGKRLVHGWELRAAVPQQINAIAQDHYGL